MTTTEAMNEQYRYRGPTIDDALRGWDGIPNTARDIHISQTAPERHRSRVLGTIRAAAEYLAGPETGAELYSICERRMLPGGDAYAQEWADSEPTRMRVAALIRLDLHGVGGRGGYEGGSTVRMKYAVQACLGKARWNASDGGAWRGAAECAAEVLAGGADVTPDMLWRLLTDLAWDDTPWVVAYARHRMALLMAQYASCAAPADAVTHSGVTVRTRLWEWDSLLEVAWYEDETHRMFPNGGRPASQMAPLTRRAYLHLELLMAGVHPVVSSDGLRVAGVGLVAVEDGVCLINCGPGEPADEFVNRDEAFDRACAATALAS